MAAIDGRLTSVNPVPAFIIGFPAGKIRLPYTALFTASAWKGIVWYGLACEFIGLDTFPAGVLETAKHCQNKKCNNPVRIHPKFLKLFSCNRDDRSNSQNEIEIRY